MFIVSLYRKQGFGNAIRQQALNDILDSFYSLSMFLYESILVHNSIMFKVKELNRGKSSNNLHISSIFNRK